MSALAACLLSVSIAASAHGAVRRQQPAPTGADPRLTEMTRRLERTFADAIVHQDSSRLERLLASDYSLRIADAPDASLPRALWLDNTLHRLKPRSVELEHVAARGLGDSMTVVAFVHRQAGTMEGRDFSGDFYVVDLWKGHGADWRLAARYSSPVGRPVARGSRVPPPPTDIDAPLTDTLGRLERQLGDVARRGFRDAQDVERLVGSDFTARFADDPERSVPRALWARAASRDTIEALDERFHAARRLADDLAVVSLVLTQKASVEGRDRSGDFYVVDIWRRRGDRWQLTARYSSRALANTGDRRPP